ncbi:MAG: ATP-dependent Clp protease proteolytic subunit [Ferruginibacter sp.]
MFKQIKRYAILYKILRSSNQNTVVQLQRIVEQHLLGGMKELHLFLSTPGGSVHDGISVYNLLKGLPITVNTYNFGSVDSIGVVIFCSGTNRFSVPHARFLLHPVSMQILGNQVFDEPLIEERLKLLKADQSNISKVIASTINKPVETVQNLIHTRTTLEPERQMN